MAVHFPQPSTASFWGIKKKTLSCFIVWQCLRFFSFKLRCEMSVMQTVVDLSKVCVTVSLARSRQKKKSTNANVCQESLQVFVIINCFRTWTPDDVESGQGIIWSCRVVHRFSWAGGRFTARNTDWFGRGRFLDWETCDVHSFRREFCYLCFSHTDAIRPHTDCLIFVIPNAPPSGHL